MQQYLFIGDGKLVLKLLRKESTISRGNKVCFFYAASIVSVTIPGTLLPVLPLFLLHFLLGLLTLGILNLRFLTAKMLHERLKTSRFL